MRRIITSILGIGLIIGTFALTKSMVADKEKPKQKQSIETKIVEVYQAKNADIALSISANGILYAKDRIDLFSEVQGIFDKSPRPFKNGTYYKKGEPIITINSDELMSSIKVSRSSFQKLLVTILPDIQFDYASSFETWENYTSKINIDEAIQPLPDINDPQEKYFITSKGIIESYYNLKSMEVKLSKHTIYAPFDGSLTNTSATLGTLIRPGQKLGEFIKANSFELELQVDQNHINKIKKGDLVKIYQNDSKFLSGKIVRFGNVIDPNTQSSSVYVSVSGRGLKEGMYMNASLASSTISDAIEIPRELLLNDNKIFIVKDSILESIIVQPVFENEKTVVVQGIPDEAILLSKMIPGMYNGLKVKPVFQQQ